MNTLACELMPSSVAYLNQSWRFVIKAAPVLSSKHIRIIHRVLACHDLDQAETIDIITKHVPLWANGLGEDAGSAGVATQNALAMLSARGATVRESRDMLLGGGSLSDPFLLSGLYEVLLKTRVLVPTSQEFAFAVTSADSAAIHTLLSNSCSASAKSGKGSKSKTAKKATGKAKKAVTKKSAQDSTVMFLGEANEAYDTTDVMDRVGPLCQRAIADAASTEFSSIVVESKGGLKVDLPLVKGVEELRDRLWESMAKRGELMMSMGGTSPDRPNSRHHEAAPSSTRETASFDFSDPDVLPYIWKMIGSCLQKEKIEALFSRFPILGNHMCHAPVNTSGIGGQGVGIANDGSFPPRSYSKMLSSIQSSPLQSYLVSLLDTKYIESSLLSSIEGNNRESIREWAVEAMIVLARMAPLSRGCMSRLVDSLSKTPLVGLGYTNPNELFDCAIDIAAQPSMQPLLPHLGSQLCDAFWNQARAGNATTMIEALHKALRRQDADSENIKATMAEALFCNFSARLSQDPACERNLNSQAAFLGVAGILHHKEGSAAAAQSVKAILASQQEQFESLKKHVETARATYLSSGTYSDAEYNPRKRYGSRVVSPPTAIDSQTAEEKIRNYKLKPQLTPGAVVAIAVEAGDETPEASIEPHASAVPTQSRVVEGQVPASFAANLLGPRDVEVTPESQANEFFANVASARFLTSAMLHPLVPNQHGWIGRATGEVAKYFKNPATAGQMGFTVPLCQSLVAHYESNSTFRSALKAHGYSEAGAVKAKLSKVNAGHCCVPVVIGDGASTFTKNATQCAMRQSRSALNEPNCY